MRLGATWLFEGQLELLQCFNKGLHRVITFSFPSKTSISRFPLPVVSYSAWETTSCSASCVDSFCQLRDIKLSNLPGLLIISWESTVNISLQTGSDLMNYTISHHPGKCMVLTNVDAVVYLEAKYNFSWGMLSISFSHSELFFHVFPGLQSVSSSDWNPYSVNPLRLTRKLGIQGTYML